MTINFYYCNSWKPLPGHCCQSRHRALFGIWGASPCRKDLDRQLESIVKEQGRWNFFPTWSKEAMRYMDFQNQSQPTYVSVLSQQNQFKYANWWETVCVQWTVLTGPEYCHQFWPSNQSFGTVVFFLYKIINRVTNLNIHCFKMIFSRHPQHQRIQVCSACMSIRVSQGHVPLLSTIMNTRLVFISFSTWKILQNIS